MAIKKSKHEQGPRAGLRTTKTRAKTARACGSNYTPTTSYRERCQGLTSVKSANAKSMKSLAKKSQQIAAGDTKEASLV